MLNSSNILRAGVQGLAKFGKSVSFSDVFFTDSIPWDDNHH